MKKKAWRSPAAATNINATSFEHCARLEAVKSGLRLEPDGPAPLARLDYARETSLKNSALRRFWERHRLPGEPEALVASPRPRHYRTTSKRRVQAGPGREGAGNAAAHAILNAERGADLLEPPGHGRIYSALAKQLSGGDFASLAQAMNYVVVRGTYEEFAVIFNLAALDRGLHRMVLKAAESLAAAVPGVGSAFLFLDPTRSPYYLESDRPKGSFSIKKLFGPDHFRLRLPSGEFAVPPTSFSQVNESILPLLLERAEILLAGRNGGRLLDLYCGYGLFALSLCRRYREVYAVDAAGGSVRAGAAMAPRFAGGKGIRFRCAAIQRSSLARVLPPPLPPGSEDVILDPPRRGASGEVIASIARRRPGRVLHLFCAVDEIPAALDGWRRQGYYVRRVVPMDMFPGTPQLETMVLLTRAS